MKKNELYSYLYDFLSVLFLKKDLLGRISSIVLFGSVARGDFSRNSDIDIFFDVKSEDYIKETEDIISSSINEFEVKARETWHLRSIKNPIKCIAGVLNDERWKALKNDIESYGIVLYGAFKRGSESLKSHSLFEYSLKGFRQKDRVAFQREIIGYKSKKKKKIYSHIGLVAKINGVNLTNNNIIVPSSESLKLQKLFTNKKVTPKIREIWLK